MAKSRKAGANKAKASSFLSKAERENYTRWRDVARKRLERLQAKGLAKNYAPFVKLRDINSRSEFEREWYRIQKFLQYGASLRKERERQKKIKNTLAEHGYNIDDLDAFGEWMEDMRASSWGNFLPSDELAEMYESIQKLEINPSDIKDNFEQWYAHRGDLAKRAERKNPKEKRKSSESIVKELAKEYGIRGGEKL